MNAQDLSYGGWPSEGPDYRGGRFHGNDVAHIATSWQPHVAKISTDGGSARRYATCMLERWLIEALSHASLSQAELARRLTEKLHRSIDRAAVNKMSKGARAISAAEMLAIEEITGFSAPTDMTEGLQRVPKLPSLVSAGKLKGSDGVQASDVEKYLILNDLPKGDWIALAVEGDSMDLVSPAGSTIFVDRSDVRLVDGGYYVVTLESREGTTYKRYRDNPDHFQPVSSNKEHGPILLDVPFVVVGRVYRSVLDLSGATGRSRKKM